MACNEDGHLSLEIKKKESDVRALQQGIVDGLHKCLEKRFSILKNDGFSNSVGRKLALTNRRKR